MRAGHKGPDELVSITLPSSGIHLYESQHTIGFQVAAHCHDVYQVLYFLGGRGIIWVDGTPYPVAASSLVVLKMGVVHLIEDDPDEPLSLYVLAFNSAAVGYHPELHLLLQPFDSPHPVYAPADPSLDEVRGLLRTMLHEQNNQQPGCAIAIQTALLALLLAGYRYWVRNAESMAQRRASPSEERMDDLRRYVDERYYEKLYLDRLAQMVHLSPRQVSTLFKRRMGTSLMSYVTQVRVNRAKELLATTDREIIAIAFEVGYENLPHFYRVFKKVTGMSPMKYREMKA